MRRALTIVASALFGCMQTAIANQSYPIFPTPSSPFYATAGQGDIVLYAGYGYNRATFDVFAFDMEQSAFVARKQYRVSDVTAVCEAPGGVVLSRPENPQIVRHRAGELTMESSEVRCPVPSSGTSCGTGRTLFHGWLPGRLDTLSICYSPDIRATTFHITSAEGVRRDLGAAGTSPGGSGRFVVTRGVQPDTYLAHHTRSAIHESAVLVDANAGTVEAFAIPDLSDARPSRGFGAGSFGVTLHPVRGGLVAEGEGGDVFFLHNGNTRLLTDGAVAQSVRIGSESCAVMLVARADAGEEFRIYDLCS
ncbi:MAG: hypothetical protein ACQEXG_18125 [Pseudomonadota bacterium]